MRRVAIVLGIVTEKVRKMSGKTMRRKCTYEVGAVVVTVLSHGGTGQHEAQHERDGEGLSQDTQLDCSQLGINELLDQDPTEDGG